MKNTELRIGNYISLHNEIFQVASIRGKYLEIRYLIEEGSVLSENVQPILITEDWLVNLGFYKYSEKHYIMKILYNSKINVYTEKGDVSIELANNKGQNFGYPEIKYVHELQNLYFALTKKELKFEKNRNYGI